MNMRQIRKFSMVKEEIILTKSIKKSIRIEDSIEVEIKYIKGKLRSKLYLIDMKVRIFCTGNTTVGLIKWICRYNHYKIKNKIINN